MYYPCYVHSSLMYPFGRIKNCNFFKFIDNIRREIILTTPVTGLVIIIDLIL